MQIQEDEVGLLVDGRFQALLPLLRVAFGEYLGEEFVLVAEVVQEAGVGDAGPFRDVTQGGLGVAVLGELSRAARTISVLRAGVLAYGPRALAWPTVRSLSSTKSVGDGPCAAVEPLKLPMPLSCRRSGVPAF